MECISLVVSVQNFDELLCIKQSDKSLSACKCIYKQNRNALRFHCVTCTQPAVWQVIFYPHMSIKYGTKCSHCTYPIYARYC